MRSPLFITLFLLAAVSPRAGAQSDSWRIYTRDNSPIPDNAVLSIAIDSAGATWIGTTMGAAKIEGEKWTLYDVGNSPLPARIVTAVAAGRDGVVWFGTVTGGIASFDGTTWRIYNSSNSGFPNNTVYTIAIDSLNHPIATTDSGFAAFDGTAWTAYDDENSGLPGPHARALAIDRRGARWVGVFDVFQVSGRIGVQAGSSWQYHNLTLIGMPSSYPAVIAIDRHDAVWMGSMGGGLGRYRNGVWEVFNHANSGLPSNGVMAVGLEGESVWLGTGGGLTRYDGAGWKVYDIHNSPLKDDYIHAVVVDREGRKWIGTGFGGLAVLESGSASGVEGSDGMADLALLGAHPNPVAAATTISYLLPSGAGVELTLHDMMGRRVALLDEGAREGGRHDIVLDAAALPSGVYLCRLSAGGRSVSRMITIAR